MQRGELDDRIAQSLERVQQSAGMREQCFDVDLVEHDRDLQALAFGGRDAARNQFVGERWLGGNHDHDLRGIGGDQLFAPFVAPVEQALAFEQPDYDPLIGTALLDQHPVAARIRTALAARKTRQTTSVGKGDLVMPSECGDDRALDRCLQNAQAWAATAAGWSAATCRCAIRAAAGGWES